MTKKKSKCDRCYYKLVCKDISLKEDSFNYIVFIIEKIFFYLVGFYIYHFVLLAFMWLGKKF